MIRFERDPAKNEINRFKHGIDFETAVLVVVHTYREKERAEVIRIISARRATTHERTLYAEAIKRETEGA